MIDDHQKNHRRSIRLKGFDYTTPGAYFVTIVTYHRQRLFGEIVDGEMRLNEYGQLVAHSWEWLPEQYPYVDLYPYVVMPDHFHGILAIVAIDDPGRGVSRHTPTGKIKPLGQLIGAFKTVSGKKINQLRSSPGAHVWQRNFYEHIIRNQAELEDIARYIYANPVVDRDPHLPDEPL